MKKLAGLLLLAGSTAVWAQIIAIGANSFADAYELNGRAAEQKFAGKTIMISGTVQYVDHSIAIPRVTLGSSVVLSMAGGQDGAIHQLQIGGPVLANCTVGTGVSLPQLTDCELFGEN